jgi:hypothetical protein
VEWGTEYDHENEKIIGLMHNDVMLPCVTTTIRVLWEDF